MSDLKTVFQSFNKAGIRYRCTVAENYNRITSQFAAIEHRNRDLWPLLDILEDLLSPEEFSHGQVLNIKGQIRAHTFLLSKEGIERFIGEVGAPLGTDDNDRKNTNHRNYIHLRPCFNINNEGEQVLELPNNILITMAYMNYQMNAMAAAIFRNQSGIEVPLTNDSDPYEGLNRIFGSLPRHRHQPHENPFKIDFRVSDDGAIDATTANLMIKRKTAKAIFDIMQDLSENAESFSIIRKKSRGTADRFTVAMTLSPPSLPAPPSYRGYRHDAHNLRIVMTDLLDALALEAAETPILFAQKHGTYIEETSPQAIEISEIKGQEGAFYIKCTLANENIVRNLGAYMLASLGPERYGRIAESVDVAIDSSQRRGRPR